MAIVKKSRGWLTIVYPESAPVNWKQALAQVGMQAVISPLHDQDINQGTDERKKPHYHVLLLWDGPTTEKNAKYVISMICGVGCFQCMSVRGSVRYFCHLDNPDKHKYNVSDLQQIGGIDLQKLLMSESDEDIMLSDIFEFIDQNGITSFKKFVDYCRVQKLEWFNLIMHKHRENVWKYLRSYEYELKGYYDDERENENEQGTIGSK